jgi:hypothetical protein
LNLYDCAGDDERVDQDVEKRNSDAKGYDDAYGNQVLESVDTQKAHLVFIILYQIVSVNTILPNDHY